MVIEAKLLAIKDAYYTMYVFKNLTSGELLMCTRPPNWQTPDLTVGEEGYLKYEIVKAGDEYYDPVTDTKIKYKYTNIYFINFVNRSEIINNEIIL